MQIDKGHKRVNCTFELLLVNQRKNLEVRKVFHMNFMINFLIMEQNSCRITTEIELNIASMQFKQIPVLHNILNLGIGFELPFTINVGGNGMFHKGKWIYVKTGVLYCYMENVKFLNVQNCGSTSNWAKGSVGLQDAMYSYYSIGQLTSLYQKFKITFEPTNNFNQEEILNEKIEEYLQILGPFDITSKIEDFTIVCGSYRYSFDKTWLAKISTVFSAMFENTNSGMPESMEDSFKPQTIATLKKILEKKNVKVEDITSELALFAEKYVLLISSHKNIRLFMCFKLSSGQRW